MGQMYQYAGGGGWCCVSNMPLQCNKRASLTCQLLFVLFFDPGNIITENHSEVPRIDKMRIFVLLQAWLPLGGNCMLINVSP
jgi:hypothetical protein